MGYPRFSARVKALLDDLSLGAEVSLLVDGHKAPPYITVAQSSGTIAVATITIVIYGKTIESSIDISDKIYDGLHNRKLGNFSLTFQNVSEGHVVQGATEVKTAVQMTYNVPVHLGNR